MNLGFVVRMARRQSRSSRRRLALYVGSVAVGIAGMVAISSFRSGVEVALADQSRQLLGADLRFESRVPFSAPTRQLLKHLADHGAKSEVIRFASMARGVRSDRTRLIEVRGIEDGYPFYGQLFSNPPEADVLMRRGEGALVEPGLLIQLDIELGDEIAIGNARYPVIGTITRIPGGLGFSGNLAPRVLLAYSALESTGLIGENSIVEYGAYLRVDRASLITSLLDIHRDRLSEERVRVMTLAEYERQISQGVSYLADYLGLVGLTALLLGGVGVASGMHLFAKERLDSAAVLRCLGARPAELLAIYGLQSTLIGALGTGVGIGIGLTAQFALPELLGRYLPFDVGFRIDPLVLVSACVLGVGASLVFALLPLFELRNVSPLRALRLGPGAASSGADPWRRAAHAVVAFSVLLASLWQAPRFSIGVGFAVGVAAALGILALAAVFAMHALRGGLPSAAPYWLRQGVGNLFRPLNQTVPVTLALGFGLFLIAALQLTQRNLLAALQVEQSPQRPNLVLFDVQSDQREPVQNLIESRGAELLDRAPIVPARIATIRGQAIAEVISSFGKEQDSGRAWGLSREYRLTYRPDLRGTEELIAGDWWSAARAPDALPRISFDRDLAAELDIGVGDPVTWDIQGVRVETRVENLRRIDWDRMATNFFVVVEPGVLERAPQNHVMLARAPSAALRSELQRDLIGAFPNLGVVDATQLLGSITGMVDRVVLAIRLMAGLTLVTGLIVLVASISASRLRRARETAMLAILGARRRTLRYIALTEYAALGALSGAVGIGSALFASWLLIHFWFELEFSAPAMPLFGLWLAAIAATAGVGALRGRRLSRAMPLDILRESEA